MFWLYRCRAPSVRAQSIQVIHSAWASAERGHEVTLAVVADRDGISSSEILSFYGLKPLANLHLRVLSSNNSMAGLQHRWVVARWLMAGGGVVVARSKRYAASLARLAGNRAQIVMEAHEVDSVQAQERGQDPRPDQVLEEQVLSACVGVIANCEGTAEVLRQAYPWAPDVAVLHNATHPGRARLPKGQGKGLVYAGSIRPDKDTDMLRHAPEPVDVLGPERPSDWGPDTSALIRFAGPVPHADLPDHLVRYAGLILTEGSGIFGQRLTSPLKLWDYLAVGRPIVAANTPAIRSACAGVGASFIPYEVGSPTSFREACAAVHGHRAKPVVRTWSQRAEELDRALESWL